MLNSLLAAYLLLVLPAQNMWRSVRPKEQRPPRTLMRRYWAMGWKTLVMLAVLAVGSRQAGYSARDLGLDMPLSDAGAWGMGIAAVLFAGLWIANSIMARRYTPEKRLEVERKLLVSSFPWPRTGAEALAFIVSTSLMTAGWELLYRGFVLLVLAPHTGMPAAVAISAIAYGLAHGYETPAQLIGSVVSAFVFTTAYALTGSLWWLIVIHAGLPLGTVPLALRAHRRLAVIALSQ